MSDEKNIWDKKKILEIKMIKYANFNINLLDKYAKTFNENDDDLFQKLTHLSDEVGKRISVFRKEIQSLEKQSMGKQFPSFIKKDE